MLKNSELARHFSVDLLPWTSDTVSEPALLRLGEEKLSDERASRIFERCSGVRQNTHTYLAYEHMTWTRVDYMSAVIHSSIGWLLGPFWRDNMECIVCFLLTAVAFLVARDKLKLRTGCVHCVSLPWGFEWRQVANPERF